MISGEPRDLANYVFMRSAADQIGQRLHGAAWTGDEFEAALTRRVFDGGLSRDNEPYARALLAAHRPDRVLPPIPRPPPPIYPLSSPREVRLSDIDPAERSRIRSPSPPTEGHLSHDDLQAADEVAREINARAAPAIERRTLLIERVVTDAEAGRLTVTLFNERNGKTRAMPAEWWRSRYAAKWFDTFQMEPARPFYMPTRTHPGVIATGFQWLFVGTGPLATYLASIATVHRPNWWPGEIERTVHWFHRDDVRAELESRLGRDAPQTKRHFAKVLAEMAREGGKPWRWSSIEIALGKHPWPNGSATKK